MGRPDPRRLTRHSAGQARAKYLHRKLQSPLWDEFLNETLLGPPILNNCPKSLSAPSICIVIGNDVAASIVSEKPPPACDLLPPTVTGFRTTQAYDTKTPSTLVPIVWLVGEEVLISGYRPSVVQHLPFPQLPSQPKIKVILNSR